MKGYEYFHKPLQTLYNIVRKSYIWLHLQSLIQEEFCACILEIIYVELHVFQHILIDYLFVYLQDFIFRTQINIFFMKSERFLTLHRQQRNWNIQGPKR